MLFLVYILKIQEFINVRFFLNDQEVRKLSKYGLFLVNIFAVAFIILIGLAMYNYKGDYSFFHNYLSDLGRTVVNGHSNSTSSHYFTAAMITAGLLSACFWFLSMNVIYNSINLPLKFKLPILIGSVVGFISAIFNALIGFYPLDTQSSMHYLVGAIFFTLAGLACTLYALFFVYLFFHYKNPEKKIEYSIISFLIPIIFSLVLYAVIKDISGLYIIFLVIVLIILNLVFIVAFKTFIKYLSYIVSFSMIVLEALIVMLLIGSGLQPVIEVTFILGIVVFIMTNNIRIIRT